VTLKADAPAQQFPCIVRLSAIGGGPQRLIGGHSLTSWQILQAWQNDLTANRRGRYCATPAERAIRED
jgi:hypothetical protein